MMGAFALGTSIDTSRLLTVAADETAASLTVTAISILDTSKSAAAAVAVTKTVLLKLLHTRLNVFSAFPERC
ncbi:MAG: hypothetical protein LBI86_04550 [Treponema sp.]|jgi:hypothetical protein|nr:hypothetical protein [Treponema sp.]